MDIRSLSLILISVSVFLFSPSGFTQDQVKRSDIHFISLSDIHFDPFLACHQQKPCALIQSLRAAPASSWAGILQSKDKQIADYRQNTTYPLFKSALEAAGNAAKAEQVEFAIILGDLLGHNYRKYYKKFSGDRTSAGYQSFVRKTMEFVRLELSKAFPLISVYMVVGNNDSYHDDYTSLPRGHFFQDTALIWSGLIKDTQGRQSMRRELPVGGYYSVNMNSKLRLIVLNSVLFSYKARGPAVEQAAQLELEWFANQLAIARENKQKVFIAMHIPPGVDIYASLKYRFMRMIELWKHDYILKYETDLLEYAPEIAAIFVGHLHTDWMQMLTLGNTGSIPMIGTPSISPIYGNNPGFKVFTYSNTMGELIDFKTFYYSLEKNVSWLTSYHFNQGYESHCRPAKVMQNLLALRSEANLLHWSRLMYSLGDSGPILDKNWLSYYQCHIPSMIEQSTVHRSA